jgi:hypothetical protein
MRVIRQELAYFVWTLVKPRRPLIVSQSPPMAVSLDQIVPQCSKSVFTVFNSEEPSPTGIHKPE